MRARVCLGRGVRALDCYGRGSRHNNSSNPRVKTHARCDRTNWSLRSVRPAQTREPRGRAPAPGPAHAYPLLLHLLIAG